MDKIYVGAIDCSFNFCGCAILRKEGTNKIVIDTTRIVVNKKLDTSGSIADIVRAKALYKGIHSFSAYLTSLQGIIALAYEVPGGSQSQRAAVCLGMAKGIIASTLAQQEIILGTKKSIELPIMPSAVHKKVTGKLKATKDEVMAYVTSKYFEQIKVEETKYIVTCVSTLGTITRNKYGKGEFEHIADALVIAELGLSNLEK